MGCGDPSQTGGFRAVLLLTGDSQTAADGAFFWN